MSKYKIKKKDSKKIMFGLLFWGIGLLVWFFIQRYINNYQKVNEDKNGDIPYWTQSLTWPQQDIKKYRCSKYPDWVNGNYCVEDPNGIYTDPSCHSNCNTNN